VIEGLRVLPGYQDALADFKATNMGDCDTCMKHHTPERRQLMRCGRLPRSTGRSSAWVPPYLRDDLTTLETCPTYTTTLAEVEEVRQVYPAFKAGYAAELLGEVPTPETIAGCVVLDNAVNAKSAHEARERAEKAGRDGPR
jgi:hypothetical protein